MPRYDKPKKPRVGSAGGGVNVLIGEALVESRGRRAPRQTPVRSSVGGAGDSIHSMDRGVPRDAPRRGFEATVGEARVEAQPDSLREAERRRYGKKARTAYTR